MAEKDITTKTIESYNDVFADIVNVFLFDSKKVIQDDELIPADVLSQYKADGKIHGQERDVSKYWHNAGIKIAFIGIENQSQPDKFMPMRVIGYDAAIYRGQLKADRDKNTADKLYCPAITIVVYFGKTDWNYGKNLFDCLDIPEELVPFVNDYQLNFYSMKDLNDEQIKKFRSDFKIIAEFFKAHQSGTEYHPTDKKLEHPEETMDMISVFAGDSSFRDEYNSLPEETKQGGISMCEIYDNIIQKGIAQGIAKGRAEGEAKGKAELVKNLLAIGRSIKEIAEFFKTDESEIQGLIAMDN